MYFTDTVEIQAPPEKVWNALVYERKFVNSRTDNVVGNTYQLHQEYPTPIGIAKCSYLMVDQPYKRMDFLLFSSPALSELKGNWTLIQTKSDRTSLTLNIEKLKSKVPVPEFLIKKVMAKIVRSRMMRIKSTAEEE